jgi:hypothetical protein
MASDKNASPVDLHRTYKQIIDERRRRIQEHKKDIAAIRASIGGAENINILADGDSWFSYPLSKDVIDWLTDDANLTNPRPLNLAVAGDPTTATLGVSKRARIIDNLSDPQNGQFDALLFSGGGDDTAGDQFCLWITDNIPGSSGVNMTALGDILGVVETAYKDLFGICKAIQPNCKILVHAYDFAAPTGVGACSLPLGGYAAGPWLKPSLDYRRWTDFNAGCGIVKQILLQFDQMMLRLESQYAPQVIYVKTQGTLIPPTSVDDQTSDWANELHPTEPGFDKIARKFLEALKLAFPGRI